MPRMTPPLTQGGFWTEGESASRRALRSSLNPRPEDTALAALCDGFCGPLGAALENVVFSFHGGSSFGFSTAVETCNYCGGTPIMTDCQIQVLLEHNASLRIARDLVIPRRMSRELTV